MTTTDPSRPDPSRPNPSRSERGRADLETLDLEAAPPHLYGRFRRDPVMRVVGAAFSHLYPRVVRRLHVADDHAVNTGVTQVRLVDRTVVAEDENVVALRFEAPDGGQLPPWYAGAHLDLLLPSGRMREYSLCGDPTDRTYYRIAVRRIPDGGGGSVEVHDDLRVGDVLPIKGPRNAFPLAVPGLGSRAEHLRFVAGGIGITPILPMIQLADRLDLDWSMVYTGRSRDSLPFVEEVLSHGDRVTVRTDDDGGIPTADELIGPDISPRTAVYSCGPIPMLDSLVARLRDVRDVELHHERFAPPPVVDGHPFTVTLASTGAAVPVGADETTLAALRRERPSVPYSCRQGFCGTCRTRVLDGAVDHRDTLLTTAEREAGWMLSCVSRAAGDSLTVDI